MPRMIVETAYEHPITEDQFNAKASKLEPCLEGHGVRWLRSYMSLDRKRRV